MKFSYERAEKRAKELRDAGVQRVVFGGKDFYSQKDAPDADVNAWRREFQKRRYHSMSLPGRHTSKTCNYLARYDIHEKVHRIRCMDGKDAVFKNFHLARYHDEFEARFHLPSNERGSLCYNFTLEEDARGRLYIIPSVTMTMPAVDRNHGFANGCIAIDMNYGHIAVSNIDSRGRLLETFKVPCPQDDKSSGQVTDIIGRAMSVIGARCEKTKKCLVIEDVDTTGAKGGLRYGSRTGNRKVSAFAYSKMTASALNQGYKRKFEVYKVNPAYTSFAGKVRYMRHYGIAIHSAASYVIGLSGMGLSDKCAPPDDIQALLPAELKDATVWKQWKHIAKAFAGVRTHAFYQQVRGEDWASRKSHELKNYAAILKAKDKASRDARKK